MRKPDGSTLKAGKYVYIMQTSGHNMQTGATMSQPQTAQMFASRSETPSKHGITDAQEMTSLGPWA
jgi:hypothetical protein